MNTMWYLHSHLVWLKLSVLSIVDLPFACLAAHDSEVSTMDNPLKNQTSTASPAEPGGLSEWASQVAEKVLVLTTASNEIHWPAWQWRRGSNHRCRCGRLSSARGRRSSADLLNQKTSTSRPSPWK
jgi:hypothetical protein